MKSMRTAAGLAVAAAILLGPAAATAAAPGQEPSAQTVALVETPIAGFPYARLYRLPGQKKRPVIVILAGAEGGDDAGKRFGPILARLGYAAVSLPYYSPNWGEYGPPPPHPDLPGSFIDIRIDQLAKLRDTLGKMHGLNISRFGLFGGSKGSEFSLIAASQYPWITSVVAYAPSDLVWEGWGLEMVEAEGTRSSFSIDGRPLPFMPYRGFVAGLAAGPAADLRAIHENGRADHAAKEEAARIAVERYRGPLLLIAGDADALWNSGRMARNIVASRTKARLRTEALLYPDAGHDLAGGSSEPREDRRGGGTAEANARARADAWPKVVAFLSRTLASRD